MTPPLAFRWAVALLELPRIVAGIALDAIDRRICRLSNDLGGEEDRCRGCYGYGCPHCDEVTP